MMQNVYLLQIVKYLSITMNIHNYRGFFCNFTNVVSPINFSMDTHLNDFGTKKNIGDN